MADKRRRRAAEGAAISVLVALAGVAGLATSGVAAAATGPDLAVSVAGNFPTGPNSPGVFSVHWPNVGTADITGTTYLTVDLPSGLTSNGVMMYTTPYDYTFTSATSPDSRHIDATLVATIVPGRDFFMKVLVQSGPEMLPGTITATVSNSTDANPANNQAGVTIGAPPTPIPTPPPTPTPTIPPPPGNLVANPGFESAGLPADWWGGKLARSSAQPRSGAYALAQTVGSRSGGWDLDGNVGWRAPAQSGKRYNASLWVYSTASGPSASLDVDFLDAGGNALDSIRGRAVTLRARTWTQLTLTGGLTTAPNQVSLGIAPRFANATKGTVLYWDDMSLTVAP